ncbi:fumarylacetoacetate hydrolase family protein [Reichenbachiella ulvae]|uniref:Fumarylacetoacetate hydrolase family protein n=1 Tax=Reichenbachiella ulvae TaxID=2980104 RepID=A0ABT3CZQ0_9BACT|nr:fumarylacetoacetate hydrolase family protein [Reichenbachiella ulvae]MCV9389170.1 fumarylacetoacetate hydrolase family protein [Reichenbachiella ulvae]
MKIVGIGKNYVNDASEMPKEKGMPVIFTKPESSLLPSGETLHLPKVSDNVWYEIELAFRIGKTCKDVKKEDAIEYIDGITLANDLTAKDVLAASREGKGPWALAKGFDGATPIADFKSLDGFPDISNINFSLEVNGEERQKGNSSLMIYSLGEVIEVVSSFMTLEPGDIILSGTPASGVAKIESGDVMVGYLEGQKVLETPAK